MSVANLTRQDGLDFLRLAPEIGIVTETTRYPLEQANEALADLRAGRFDRRRGPRAVSANQSRSPLWPIPCCLRCWGGRFVFPIIQIAPS